MISLPLKQMRAVGGGARGPTEKMRADPGMSQDAFPKPVVPSNWALPVISEAGREFRKGHNEDEKIYFFFLAEFGARKTRVRVLPSPLANNVTSGKALRFLDFGVLPWRKEVTVPSCGV